MNSYRHILLAVDLSAESNQIVERAIELRRAAGAVLSVIHVVEPISYPYGPYAGVYPMEFGDIQNEIEQKARTSLDALCEPLDVPGPNRHLVVGRSSTEIHRVAEDIRADLIVVGSHGKHGLELWLGSTATAVLHRAKCDVLAVRLKPAAS